MRVVLPGTARILGLGDLGANGMGIPIGKLALYCAAGDRPCLIPRRASRAARVERRPPRRPPRTRGAGGIAPHRVLPVVVDVGTNNVALRESPQYLGLKQDRLQGQAYFDVIDEFVAAVRNRWPKVLIQFEDFESSKAQPLLDRAGPCCYLRPRT